MVELTTLCYIESGDSYLMLHRTKKEHDINEGKWIGVGGHLEPEETPEECVRREVLEETGLTLNSLRFRGVIHFSSGETEEEMFVYTSNSFTGDLIDCREGELAWVKKSDVLSLNLWEGDRVFLPLLMGETEFFRFSLAYDSNGVLTLDPIAEKGDDLVILQERHAIARFGEKLTQYGSRALVVTGRVSAKENGALRDLKSALDAVGIHHVVFDEVEENPSTDTVLRAREMGRMAQVDFVIGVGGGSALDAAKAIALMIYYHDEEKSFLYESGHESTALPVVAVPTTAGTGSEATGVAVLTRKERHTKGSIPFSILPKLALLDASYLKSLPREILGNTAIDALSHLMESILSTKATPLSRAYAMQGLLLWRKVKDVISGRREATETDFSNLLTASSLAGLAIAITGTSLPHALSYTLTVEANLPHGKAVGFFLPRFLKEAGDDGLLLARTAGFFDIEELQGFYTAVSKPGSIEPELLGKAVESVAVKPEKLASAPFDADRAVLLRLAGLE